MAKMGQLSLSDFFLRKVRVKIKNLPDKYKDVVRIVDCDMKVVELKEGKVVIVTRECADILVKRGIAEFV